MVLHPDDAALHSGRPRGRRLKHRRLQGIVFACGSRLLSGQGLPSMIKRTVASICELIDEQRLLALAVVVDGSPYAGLLPYAVLPNRAGVLVHASALAKHSRGLSAGGPATVLLHEPYGPDKDPLQIKRVTFECLVHPLERKGEAWEQVGWADVEFSVGEESVGQLLRIMLPLKRHRCKITKLLLSANDRLTARTHQLPATVFFHMVRSTCVFYILYTTICCENKAHLST